MAEKENRPPVDQDHAPAAPILAEECLAWARMRRKRLCPPLDFLARGAPMAREHLAQCPECAGLVREYEAMGGSLPKAAPAARGEGEAPAPGQLRRILLKAAPADADEMYTPPLVVILDIIDSRLQLVQVAQVHDEAALAADGDIPLPSGYFAESWNVYPMLAEYLGAVLATVPPAMLREIAAASERPLPEVAADTPLQAMRELEIETGFFFNASSYARALELLEPQAAPGEKANGARRILFAGGDGAVPAPERREAGKTHFRSAWKPLGMVACLVLLLAAVVLDRLAPQSGEHSAQEVAETRQAALTEMVAALRLFLASGGEATRGDGPARPLAWQRKEARADIPPKWRAFAAGQWTARAASGQTEPPFPKAWLPEGGEASGWRDDPYFALGLTAYAADAACAGASTFTGPLAKSLAGAAHALEGRFSGDAAASRFMEALRQAPPSCSRIQEALDELESDSPLY